MSDKTFKKVGRLKLENRRSVGVDFLEDGTGFLDLENKAEAQYFYFMYDEAIALQDWLSTVTGYYPQEQKRD